MKLIKSTIKNEPFDSSMLEVGEMMECTDLNGNAKGHILLRIYANTLVSLDCPNKTWNVSVKLQGRKLSPGESVTLIQE
jgi:hypothetical protein